MSALLKRGFDIEWHICVIEIEDVITSSLKKGMSLLTGEDYTLSLVEANKYRALAEATGGSFLLIEDAAAVRDSQEQAVYEKLFGKNDADAPKVSRSAKEVGKFLEALGDSQNMQDEEDRRRRDAQRKKYELERNEAQFEWLKLMDYQKEKRSE